MGKMGNILRGFVVGLAVLGLAGVVGAQGEALIASGKIVSIDPQQQLIKLRTGLFSTKEFTMDRNVEISAGQQSLKLEQLQPGDKATVEYKEEGGERIAQAIKLEGAGAEPAPMAPATSQAPEPQAAPESASPSFSSPEAPPSSPSAPESAAPSAVPSQEPSSPQEGGPSY